MTRYELTISPDYVPDWGVWEGVRELLQNATDSEADGHPKSVWYDKECSTMYIANAGASLKRSNLLLGDTTKATKNMIGKWGEGFKLAFICLLRSGLNIRILTSTETWTPRFIHSKRYRSRLMVVDVEAVRCPWATGHLIFEVCGVTPQQFDDISKNYLGFQECGENIVGSHGTVLLDPSYAKKVYVAGLYVCTIEHSQMRYGYDFAPNAIELDRDRRSVSWFNLFWETSAVFASTKDSSVSDVIHDLVLSGAPDIDYYQQQAGKKTKLYLDVCEQSYKKFIETHGKQAVPVKNPDEADLIRNKFNGLVPVILTEKQIEYVSSAPSFISSTKSKVAGKMGDINTPYRVITRFLQKHKQRLSKFAIERIEKELVPESKHWARR